MGGLGPLCLENCPTQNPGRFVYFVLTSPSWFRCRKHRVVEGLSAHRLERARVCLCSGRRPDPSVSVSASAALLGSCSVCAVILFLKRWAAAGQRCHTLSSPGNAGNRSLKEKPVPFSESLSSLGEHRLLDHSLLAKIWEKCLTLTLVDQYHLVCSAHLDSYLLVTPNH